MSKLPEPAKAFVRWLWSRYVQTRVWPKRIEALHWLEDAGLNLADMERAVPTLSVGRLDASGPDRVAVGLRGLVHLAEVKDLLKPLPQLVRHANKRLRLFPTYNNQHDERAAIPHDEVQRIWRTDTDTLALAGEILLRASGLGGLNISGGPQNFTVYPSLDALRYRGVRTVEKLIDISDRRWTPRPPTPEAIHIRFVQKLLQHAGEHLEWPNATRFAVTERRLGFVPDLVSALWPRFVVHEFGYFTTDRISLHLWALALNEDAEPWRARVPAMARAIAKLWRQHDGETFLLGELAAEARLSVSDGAVLALLMESEPWARGFYFEGSPETWRVGAHEDMRKFRDCTTWDEYLAVRQDTFRHWMDQFGEVDNVAHLGDTPGRVLTGNSRPIAAIESKEEPAPEPSAVVERNERHTTSRAAVHPPEAANLTRAPCARCGGMMVQQEVVGQYRKTFKRGDDPHLDIDWERAEWEILQCRGCGEGSFRHTSYQSDDVEENDSPRATITLYPPRGLGTLPKRKFDRVPPKLKGLYTETITAFNNHLYTVAAASVRGLVEGICKHRGVKSGHVKVTRKDGSTRVDRRTTLEGKISGLVEAGLLTQAHAKTLHAHRFLGNDALHDLYMPEPERVAAAIGIVEHTFDNLYELSAKGKVARGKRRRNRKP